MKKRYIIYLMLLLSLIFGFGLFGLPTQPVLPTIQLPGEPVIPGIPVLGSITNTFIATIVTYVLIFAGVFAARARSRTVDEVPTGFYNAIEAIIEGARSFSQGTAGRWTRSLFPYFMSFIILILIANWLELVPSVDSVGRFEYLPLAEAEKAVQEAEQGLAANETPFQILNAAPISSPELTAEIATEFNITPETILAPEQTAEFLHLLEEAVIADVDAANVGALKRGNLLIRASEDEEGNRPEDADWSIIPFLRAPATDLNFTIALALVSVFMTQVIGLRALGAPYLRKYFNWNADKIARSPMNLMDFLVGIIELISEVFKILSFSFRLFGNIFAGQVLLFIVGFLVPVLLIGVYGLEFAVGAIQAVIFGLLTLTFMAGATALHGDDDEH